MIIRTTVRALLLCAAVSAAARAQTAAPLATFRAGMPPRVDSQAVRLLTAAATALRQASSIRGDVRTVSVQGQYRASHPLISRQTVRATRNGLGWFASSDSAWNDSAHAYVASSNAVVCTPTATVRATPVITTVYTARYDDLCTRTAAEIDAVWPFFDPRAVPNLLRASTWDTTGRTMNPLVRSLTYVGRESWNGAPHDVVEWKYESSYTMPKDTLVFTQRLYIDTAMHLRRVVTSDTYGNHSDQQVLSLAVGAPVSAGDFAWTPPAGAIVDSEPVPRVRESRQPLMGQQFPNLDRTVPFLDDSATTLRRYLAGKKGALLWFWNTSCIACMAEFPHLEQLYRAMRGRGVEVVVLDIAEDEAKDAHLYRVFHNTTMPVVLSKVVTEPLAKAGGSFLVVDSTGTVVYRTASADYLQFWRVLDGLASKPVTPAAATWHSVAPGAAAHQ